MASGIWPRLFWGLMALHILNMSVEVADIGNHQLLEDPTYNDQESIFELLVEQVLGFEDAVMEHESNNTGDHHQNGQVKVHLMNGPTALADRVQVAVRAGRVSFPDLWQYPTAGFGEMDGPPPKG
jgi:hypothetical protein